MKLLLIILGLAPALASVSASAHAPPYLAEFPDLTEERILLEENEFVEEQASRLMETLLDEQSDDTTEEEKSVQAISSELVAAPPLKGDARCMLPMTTRGLDRARLRNPNAKLPELQSRYLVADLVLLDKDGRCKGLSEVMPGVEDRLWVTSKGGSTPKFPQSLLVKPPSQSDCRAQTMNLCQIDGDTVRLVARFALSSGAATYGYPGQGYAFENTIATRHGHEYPRSQAMADFDRLMGGGDEIYMARGPVNKRTMPNFLNFLPTRVGPQRGNGIHRWPVTSGMNAYTQLGKPASHGCMRLSTNGSRFTRDWTPVGARLFIIHPKVK